MLAKLGEIKPSLSGSCKLMRKDTEEQAEGARPAESIKLMGMGLITTMTVYLLGTYVNKLIPAVHTYAWMILLVAVSKALGIVPKSMEHTVQQWSQFVMGNWTQALLVGIGISMIDLSAVISAFSFTYLILAEAIIMDYAKESLRLHSQWKGKIEVAAAVPGQGQG